MDVETCYDGILAAIVVPEGETAPVGAPIGLLCRDRGRSRRGQGQSCRQFLLLLRLRFGFSLSSASDLDSSSSNFSAFAASADCQASFGRTEEAAVVEPSQGEAEHGDGSREHRHWNLRSGVQVWLAQNHLRRD